ncbi:MAG TPA: hypothetical protein DE312_04875 [Gallionella sp.]|nr:MAG: hypothetical protein A2Z87_07970 [Gallionellales bacterium GWA2_54_124]OGT18633.1 MAG: hypothetical protein A2522_00310 [Gallionellales bacterium RIFOXYD12_FULL_53_10]HCI52638.1 hypothetical protein [Gallionella sp.]
MKKDERTIYCYDLAIEASSQVFKAPKTITVRRAFELMELISKEQRKKLYHKGQLLLYVADWEWKENVISILVNKSDKSISDPVFTVPEEGKRRTVAKEAKEGQDFSAHIVVKLNQNDAIPALVLIEYCSGLGIAVIEKLFNQILKDSKLLSPGDFEQAHPDGSVGNDGKPKKLNIIFKCAFQGHLSDELQDDLNKGKVQSIELITEKNQFTPFDEDGYIKEKCKSITLTLKDEDRPISDKFKRIVQVFKKHNNDYSKARIKFKTAEGIDRTVDMDTADGLAQAYVKKARIDGFNGDLESSYESFNTQILGRMKALV